jgi:hypothetical protein
MSTRTLHSQFTNSLPQPQGGGMLKIVGFSKTFMDPKEVIVTFCFRNEVTSCHGIKHLD